jgi:hypothetical protein
LAAALSCVRSSCTHTAAAATRNEAAARGPALPPPSPPASHQKAHDVARGFVPPVLCQRQGPLELRAEHRLALGVAPQEAVHHKARRRRDDQAAAVDGVADGRRAAGRRPVHLRGSTTAAAAAAAPAAAVSARQTDGRCAHDAGRSRTQHACTRAVDSTLQVCRKPSKGRMPAPKSGESDASA